MKQRKRQRDEKARTVRRRARAVEVRKSGGARPAPIRSAPSPHATASAESPAMEPVSEE
jgi:hypothetical protein